MNDKQGTNHTSRVSKSTDQNGLITSYAAMKAAAMSQRPARTESLPVTAEDLRQIEELIIDLRTMMRHADDCGPGCTCDYEPLMERSRKLLPVRMALHDGSLIAALGAAHAEAPAGVTERI